MAKQMTEIAERMAERARRHAPCSLRFALVATAKVALEGDDCAREMIQALEDYNAAGPEYELPTLEDYEHVGILEGRAAGDV